VLKEHQAGLPVAELCRKHGISGATFHNWRSRYGCDTEGSAWNKSMVRPLAARTSKLLGSNGLR
jgi:putative transposase